METQLMISQRLGYVQATDVDPLLAKADEVGRVLRGLHRSLGRRAALNSQPSTSN
jgi:hypothetical protein